MKVILENNQYTLDLTVSEGTDLDSKFLAWDNNENEFITVCGWLFSVVS